jgi:uncharacterized membrane protein
MDAFLIEWVSLLLRWLHVIAAIAWIGSSFFFMHLDASLRPAEGVPREEGGVAWEVHGGGFYEMRKYLVAPERMPEELTWHKWQAYTTWISGVSLLICVYYAQATLFLIDPAVMALTPLMASLIGIAALAGGWIIYDLLCRLLGKEEVVLAALGFAFIVAVSVGLVNVFSTRGALIHVGSLMATIMSANVFFVIIPNQRKVIKQLLEGQTPDPALGQQGKTRSTHNNYLTLPVVFLMLSSHYPMTYAGKTTVPIVVACVLIAGAVIRHFYNIRHSFNHSPWWYWGVAAAALIIAAITTVVTSPGGSQLVSSLRLAHTKSPPSSAVVDVVLSRCSMCHTNQPVWPGLALAPKGVVLDSPEAILKEAGAIRIQSVLTHVMPPNNITQMTDQERQTIASWLSQ